MKCNKPVAIDEWRGNSLPELSTWKTLPLHVVLQHGFNSFILILLYAPKIKSENWDHDVFRQTQHNYTIALLPALWPSDMKPTTTCVVNDANKYIFILGVKKGLPRFVWYLLNCSWRSVLTRYDMLIWSHFDPETKKREKYAKEMIISVHNYNRLSDKVKTTTMILMHCTTLQTQYMVTWINDILKVGKYTGTTRSLIPWSLLAVASSK